MSTVVFDGGAGAVSVVGVPGSLVVGGGHDDRGGGVLPRSRAGEARVGRVTCVVLDSGDQSLGSLLGLRSGVGPGVVSVSGDEVADVVEALVDVTIGGAGVQTAVISWAGTCPVED